MAGENAWLRKIGPGGLAYVRGKPKPERWDGHGGSSLHPLFKIHDIMGLLLRAIVQDKGDFQRRVRCREQSRERKPAHSARPVRRAIAPCSLQRPYSNTLVEGHTPLDKPLATSTLKILKCGLLAGRERIDAPHNKARQPGRKRRPSMEQGLRMHVNQENVVCVFFQ